MTRILKDDDKIFTMYTQYKELIHSDSKESGELTYGVDQMASRLTIAHMLDHVACLLKGGVGRFDIPPTTIKVNDAWMKKNKKPFITGTATEDSEIDWNRND